ncbi:MAG: dienelactone hydrolase family protein [Desulfovibrio sp.]|jgi:dienelactone hydrolase|nr:dienelactone hydrolase family protein [Desulfovibrio sp.]
MNNSTNTPDFCEIRHVAVGEAAGDLYIPHSGNSPWPSVVILNSSAGVCETRERFYALFLAARGIAALVVDSFTPRGVIQTTTDQSQFNDIDMEQDAYAAYDLLAATPCFDSRHIAAMGVSKGGSAVINTALTVRRRTFNRSPHDFSVRVALVPPAHLQQRDARTDGRPLLLLLAEKDDYTGVRGAMEYAARMIAAGNSLVEVRVYPGAHHAFERTGSLLYLARAENFSRRLFMVEDDGTVSDEAGRHMTWEEFLERRHEYLTLGAHAGGGTEELKELVAGDIYQFLATDLG